MSLNMSSIPKTSRVNIIIAINNAILYELFHSSISLSDDEKEALKKLYLDNMKELMSE